MFRRWILVATAVISFSATAYPQSRIEDINKVADALCNPGQNLQETRLNAEVDGSFSIVEQAGKALLNFTLGYVDLPGLLGRLSPELAAQQADKIRDCMVNRVVPLLEAMFRQQNRVLIVDSLLKRYRRVEGASNADDIQIALDGTRIESRGSYYNIEPFTIHTGPAYDRPTIVQDNKPNIVITHLSAFENIERPNPPPEDRPCDLTASEDRNQCIARFFRFVRPLFQAGIPIIVYSRTNLCTDVMKGKFREHLGLKRSSPQSQRPLVFFLNVPEGSNFTNPTLASDISLLVQKVLSRPTPKLRTTNMSCSL